MIRIETRTLRDVERRLLPRGWSDLARQLLLFAVAYYAYQLVRGAADGKAAVATWNATTIIDIEQSLGLFVEPSVQLWAARTGWVADVAAWTYINSHFVVTVGGLAYIYVLRNESFYFVRNMFMVAMGLALVGYAAFPTAPPRLMPEWGFTDTVATFTGVRVENEPVSALLNLYAAVPSMHVCFALMIGVPLARLARSRAVRVAWSLYPVVVAFVVVATGNHWILDAVLGTLTAAAAALVAQVVLARRRPQAWAFHAARRRPAR